MTASTDTQQLPRIVIDGDTTREVDFPWLMPPVTATYRRPDSWQQLRTSAFAADVHSGWQRALAALGVLGVAYFGLLLARGAWVAAELLAAMTRPDQIQAACLAITALCGIGLLLLRNPRSSLSRLVDRPDENTNEGNAR